MNVLAVLIVLGLLTAVHWYVWRRLIRDTTAPGSRARRAGTVAAFVFPALTVTAVAGPNLGIPFPLQPLAAWPGFLWGAVLIYLLLGLLVSELLRPVLMRVALRRSTSSPADQAAPSVPAQSPTDPAAAQGQAPPSEPAGADAHTTDAPELSRRLLVSRGIAATVAVAAVGTVGAGTASFLGRPPQIKQITVPLARLPRSAHGMRIAVVSDIHLSAILGRAHTQRITDTINSTQPDLIAVVGDLADGEVHDLGRAAVPLGGLRSRHGTYFVTGNHDYLHNAPEWLDHLRNLGLVPLENARVEMPGFDLAGVNDLAGERYGSGPDFGKALNGRDPARGVVLLSHQPVTIHDAVRHGVDLQLSGHTHGGQLWPGPLLAELANPTVAGLDRYGDTQLYVTHGAGAWGPPTRIGAPADITVIQLASKQA